jgi:ubiquinone/menaquinone biosynthesis C-methylase UbiE
MLMEDTLQGSAQTELEISYLGMAGPIHHLSEPAIRAAIDALQLPSGSRGLDAGCGIGTHTLWLAEATSPGGHVTGVDISRQTLARAEKAASKTEFARQVSFQYGDLRALPFGDHAFDWAWCADTLWPVADTEPLPLVQELVRVVRPGGHIAVLFWSSQKLLPGYPLLEAALNATRGANFPYTKDTKPEWHILRALGWLQAAGVENARVRTFVADAHAPLKGTIRTALAASFQMLWANAQSEMSAEDWSAFRRLCQPQSADFILNRPDYYAFVTYSLFHGRVRQ